MNPKEVSYSHPQLPLCDTPNADKSGRLPELRRKSTAFPGWCKGRYGKICRIGGTEADGTNGKIRLTR